MALPQYRASVVPGLVVTGEVEIADEGGVDIVAAAEATLIGGVATALAVKATRVVAVIVVVAAVVAIEAVVSIADVQEANGEASRGVNGEGAEVVVVTEDGAKDEKDEVATVVVLPHRQRLSSGSARNFIDLHVQREVARLF